jgi:hypothetical protein
MNCLNSVLLEGYVSKIQQLDDNTSLIILASERDEEVLFSKIIIKNKLNEHFLKLKEEVIGEKVRVVGRLADYVVFKTVILADHIELSFSSNKKIFECKSQMEFDF